MTAHGLQPILAIAAVVIAAGYCAWRWMPRLRATLASMLARRLDRAGRPAWLRRLGAGLAPSAGGDCDDGCGGCGGCAPKAARQTVHVIHGPGSDRIGPARH